MDVCDVLIVGGGPGGSTCARELRGYGFDVVVMDRRDFPRNKVCAGWITASVVKALKLDTEEYASQRVLQPITGFRVAKLGSAKALETHYDEPENYGLLRRQFDDYLLRRSGARLRLGEGFKKAVRVGDRWRVNDSIEARVIIGAGGHFCPVARMLGAGAVTEVVVSAQEVEFEMTAAQRRECLVAPEVPELFFEPDLKGYGWCFRKGDYLNIGFGRESAQRLTERSHAFLSYYQNLGRIPREITAKFAGHAYIMYGHTQREMIGDGVLLIGDAAGLAYPGSGEGIITAIESGILGAQTLHAAAGNYSREALEAYRTALLSHFGKPRPAPEIPRLALPIIHALLGFPLTGRLLMEWAFKGHEEPVIAKSSFARVVDAAAPAQRAASM